MRHAIVLMLAGVALFGCGKKGPPVAPEHRIPSAVADLSAVVEGSGIILTWNKPNTRADGSRLKDLTLFRIHRREAAAEGEPKPAILSWGKVVGYDEIAVIPLADPAPAKIDGSRLTWVDHAGLTFGRRYAYALTALDSIGRSSLPSRGLAVRFLAAPRPPEGLTASPGDGAVRLAWSPPALLVDGSRAPRRLAYQVLRAPSTTAPFSPVTPEPITATTLTDRGLNNAQPYYYAVRAVRSEPRGSAWSIASPVVAATPVDRTPPSPPANLVAVPSETQVHLAWDASPEPDVAGYFVYRAATPAVDFVRLTMRPVFTTNYVDRTVARGKTYRYAVTAVDRAARPNESTHSASASATVP